MGPSRCTIQLYLVLFVCLVMCAQVCHAFRAFVRHPTTRRGLLSWSGQATNGGPYRQAAGFHLSAGKKSSSEDGSSAAGAGQGEKRGRGPRNRNARLSEEEELFAALTTSAPVEEEKRGKKAAAGKGGEAAEGDFEAPVVEWKPEPGSVVLEALKDLRVKRLEVEEEKEDDVAAARPKPKKQWVIDTEWSSPKPIGKGHKAAGGRRSVELEPMDDVGDLPRSEPKKPKKAKAAPVVVDEDDFDDDDEPDFSEEALQNMRFVDVSDLGGAEGWEDFGEDEGDEDELDDDDDDDDIVLPMLGRQMSMEERLANAQRGAIVNPYVGTYGGEGKKGKAEVLGNDDDDDFDEQAAPEPVRYQFKIVVDVGTCPGCGNQFQTKNESVPGFVPVDVYDRLQKRAAAMRAAAAEQASGGGKKKKQKGKAQEEVDLYESLSPEQEVELLVSGKVNTDEWLKRQEEAALALAREDAGEDEEEEQEDMDRHVICQRCHRLKHYGMVDDSLRPGWSDHEMLTPDRFREMISVVRKKRCAIVCLVDAFDFHGTLLYNLARIAGENPVTVAVNKADLLPSDFKEDRVKIWVKQQLDRVGVKDVTTRDIFLISGKSGMGVKPLLRHMKTMARLRKRDLYVIGAANVGKSTFINRLIELGRTGGEPTKKKKAKKGGKEAGTLVTTSALPGTTLNFIEVDLGDRVSLYDTPGLIIPHQLTTLLNTDELKAVIPQKRVNHVTLRLGEGKSVLMGGLARLDFVTGRPFLFTFYVSNDVKLHLTSTDRTEEFLEKHIGTDLIFPPFDEERLKQLGPAVWTPREFNITGNGWKTSTVDIVISGLGWISVTGALDCTVRVMAHEAVGVRLRDPLMPYETWDTTARWTGIRAVKTNKKKGGSR